VKKEKTRKKEEKKEEVTGLRKALGASKKADLLL